MEHIGLSKQEVQRIEGILASLDAAESGSASDRRVRPRIDYAHPMWLCRPEAGEQGWMHIYSRNLSTGGLAFLARGEFLPGEQLVVSHALGEKTPQLVLGSVKFCRIVYVGICEVGMEFVLAKSDPERRRDIPAEWVKAAQQSAWMARQAQAPF